MSSDLIVNSPFCLTTPPLEADYRKYPAEHSRSAGRAGVLKIDCLLNDPAPGAYKLAPSGSSCEPKIASLEWNKRDVAPRTQRHVRADRFVVPWKQIARFTSHV